ncbi:MAG: hypothetical protein ABWW70_07530, partial [Thermoproteota archaeon]
AVAYILAAALLDLAVLALPLPRAVAVGLAPFAAGLAAGLLAGSRRGAAGYALASALVAVAAALAYNYARAPAETLLAVAKPIPYSLLPLLVQPPVAVVAALGARLLAEQVRGRGKPEQPA